MWNRLLVPQLPKNEYLRNIKDLKICKEAIYLRSFHLTDRTKIKPVHQVLKHEIN